MKVCIAGGGRVGMYLAQSLLSHHHKVTIIEPQEALCRTLPTRWISRSSAATL